MSEQLDIDEIMAEIRAEAERNAAHEALPAFEDQPVMASWLGDVTVACTYPMAGNPLKRAYGRLVSKLIRVALFPVTERITKINADMKNCIEDMAGMIEEQREEIDALNRRLEELEKGR